MPRSFRQLGQAPRPDAAHRAALPKPIAPRRCFAARSRPQLSPVKGNPPQLSFSARYHPQIPPKIPKKGLVLRD